MMRNMPAPELVVHADWGTHPRKRQVATAQLIAGTAPEDATYRIVGLQAVDPVDPLGSLARQDHGETTLVGIDFPIGLPVALGRAGRIDHFPTFLRGQMGDGAVGQVRRRREDAGRDHDPPTLLSRSARRDKARASTRRARTRCEGAASGVRAR